MDAPLGRIHLVRRLYQPELRGDAQKPTRQTIAQGTPTSDNQSTSFRRGKDSCLGWKSTTLLEPTVSEFHRMASIEYRAEQVNLLRYSVAPSLSRSPSAREPPLASNQEEPFNLPDVVICPSAGDGCNGSDGSDCLPMDWFLSAVEVSSPGGWKPHGRKTNVYDKNVSMFKATANLPPAGLTSVPCSTWSVLEADT